MLLQTSRPPGRGGRKVLLRWTVPLDPHWEVTIVSSHNSVQTFLWLVARRTLERLSREESLLLALLGAEYDEMHQSLSLLEKTKNTFLSSPATRGAKKEIFHSTRQLLQRILCGYEPEWYVRKKWVEKRFPPKRTVGVGYNDKGSLSSRPSWKDQIIWTEEENLPAKIEEIHTLMIQLSFLDFLLSRRTWRPADEPQ